MPHAATPLPSVEPARTRQFRVIPGFRDGPPPARREPAIENAQLAVLVFIAFEAMIFTGLLVAYWVLRSGSFVWPPPNLPRLPLAVTSVNTCLLLLSAFTMWRSVAAVRAGRDAGLRTGLAATTILGTAFVAIQGSEWVRLVGQGLRLSSGTYGATFYTLIGLHAAHVVGAVIWLAVVFVLAQRGRFSARANLGVRVCATYWYFVCILWVVLFGAVYLY